MILPTGKNRRFQKGFTFFEVMVTIVILGIGLTGIYRAFLISLNYQQHILDRLHILNFLSDEFARDENFVITQGNAPSYADLTSIIPEASRIQLIAETQMESFDEILEGLFSLRITVYMRQKNKERTFTRSSFVYGKKKTQLSK